MKRCNDTLHIKNLGNGNAALEFISYSPKLSGDGFRKKSKKFSATYNPDNEHLDIENFDLLYSLPKVRIIYFG